MKKFVVTLFLLVLFGAFPAMAANGNLRLSPLVSYRDTSYIETEMEVDKGVAYGFAADYLVGDHWLLGMQYMYSSMGVEGGGSLSWYTMRPEVIYLFDFQSEAWEPALGAYLLLGQGTADGQEDVDLGGGIGYGVHFGLTYRFNINYSVTGFIESNNITWDEFDENFGYGDFGIRFNFLI